MSGFGYLPGPYITELKQFAGLGYTVPEVLQIATRTNAQMLDMGDKFVSVRALVRVVLASVSLSIGSSAFAQTDTISDTFWAHPFHANAFAGGSFPTGQWRNSFDAAYDGGISVAWPVTPGSGIWLEGHFNGQAQLMNDATQTAFGAVGGGANILSLTLNIVANARDLFDRFTPYVVGGGGGYSRKVELDNFTGNSTCDPFIGFCGVYGPPANRSRTQNVLGWDVGGGVRFRVTSFRLFVEARYNTAYTRYASTTFVPVVFGIAW